MGGPFSARHQRNKCNRMQHKIEKKPPRRNGAQIQQPHHRTLRSEPDSPNLAMLSNTSAKIGKHNKNQITVTPDFRYWFRSAVSAWPRRRAQKRPVLRNLEQRKHAHKNQRSQQLGNPRHKHRVSAVGARLHRRIGLHAHVLGQRRVEKAGLLELVPSHLLAGVAG